MPLIGFIMFHDEVKDGATRQTIRRHRKLPVKVGDTIYFYWHLRKKDCHLLRVEKCVETFAKPWRTLKFSEDIAKRDGCKSSAKMREWFSKTYHLLDDRELLEISTKMGDKEMQEFERLKEKYQKLYYEPKFSTEEEGFYPKRRRQLKRQSKSIREFSTATS
jgi:hypothetical protein